MIVQSAYKYCVTPYRQSVVIGSVMPVSPDGSSKLAQSVKNGLMYYLAM